MGIWVVVLEAVAGDDPSTIEPDDLDALADELAECYPQVAGGPAFYQAEFWVEESNAGGAVMHALRVWQAAIRELGMPSWDVVRAEARDAHAIEAGLIDWAPPAEDEPDDEPVDDDVLAEDEPDDDLEEDDDEEELPTPRERAGGRAGRLRPVTDAPAGRTARAWPASARAASAKPAVKKPAARKTSALKPAAKKSTAVKAAARKTRVAAAPRSEKAVAKPAAAGAVARGRKSGASVAKRR